MTIDFEELADDIVACIPGVDEPGRTEWKEAIVSRLRREVVPLQQWIVRAKNSFSLRDCRKCGSPVFPGHVCGYCQDDDSVD